MSAAVVTGKPRVKKYHEYDRPRKERKVTVVSRTGRINNLLNRYASLDKFS